MHHNQFGRSELFMVILFSNFRAKGAVDFESLKNDVILDLEKTEDKLMHR